MNTETAKLLKECNSGCKTAVDNIDQVREHIRTPALKKRIEECSRRHTELGERCHSLLCRGGEDPCAPLPSAWRWRISGRAFVSLSAATTVILPR